MNGLSLAFNGQPANCGRSEKPLRFTWVRVVNHWTDRLWVLADIPLPLHFCDLKQFPLSWVVNHGQRIGNLRCFSATKIIIQISYWTRAPLQVIVSGRFVVNAFSASPGGANDGRFSKQTNKTNYRNVSASSRPVISFFFKWKIPTHFRNDVPFKDTWSALMLPSAHLSRTLGYNFSWHLSIPRQEMALLT